MEKKIRSMGCNPVEWEKNGLDYIVPIPNCLCDFLWSFEGCLVSEPRKDSEAEVKNPMKW